MARHRPFRASSEQLAGHAGLFDQAKVLAQGDDRAPPPAEGAPDTDVFKQPIRPSRGKRGPWPAHRQRIDVIHGVTDDQHRCPCGTPMVEIGGDISEHLDSVPMQVRVLRHIRKR